MQPMKIRGKYFVRNQNTTVAKQSSRKKEDIPGRRVAECRYIVPFSCLWSVKEFCDVTQAHHNKAWTKVI